MSKKSEKAARKAVQSVSADGIVKFTGAVKLLVKSISKGKFTTVNNYMEKLDFKDRTFLKAALNNGIVSREGRVYSTKLKAKEVDDVLIAKLILEIRNIHKEMGERTAANKENGTTKNVDSKDSKKSKGKKDKKDKKGGKKGKNKGKNTVLKTWFTE